MRARGVRIDVSGWASATTEQKKQKKRTSRSVAQSGKDANLGKGNKTVFVRLGASSSERPSRGRTCERLVIPSTKQMASRMLLLPEPFRPVMALNRGSNAGTTVRCAYDLNPSMHTSSTYLVFFVERRCRQGRSAPSARLREREGRVRPVRVRAARRAATRSGDACLVPRGDVLRARPCEERARSSHDSTPPSYETFLFRASKTFAARTARFRNPRRATPLTFVVRAFPPCHRYFPATPRGALWVCPDVVRDARGAAGGGDARA